VPEGGSIDTRLEAKLRRYLSSVQVAIKKKNDSKLGTVRRAFKDVLSKAKKDEIKAAAWNGVGETYFYLSKPDYLEALLAFSHVWLRFEEQAGEMAKSLYHASHAYMKMADVISPNPDMPEKLKDRPARMLWSRLKKEYGGSAWAKRSGPKRFEREAAIMQLVLAGFPTTAIRASAAATCAAAAGTRGFNEAAA